MDDPKDEDKSSNLLKNTIGQNRTANCRMVSGGLTMITAGKDTVKYFWKG